MRLYQTVMVMVAILIFFNAAGYRPPASGLVGTMVFADSTNATNPTLSNIESTTWYDELVTVLLLAGGVGIVAGLFFTLPSISYLVATGLSLFISLFLVDMIWLYGKIIEHGDTWMVLLMTTIMSPLVIGFILTAIEWWKGGGD